MRAMKRISFVKDLKNPKFTYELEKTNETVIKIFQFDAWLNYTCIVMDIPNVEGSYSLILSVKSYLLHSCTYDWFLLFKSSFCL